MKVASGRSKPSCLLGFLHFSSINSASGMRDAPFSLDGNNVQTRDPRVPQSRPNGIVLPILSSFKVRSGQTWTFQASGKLNHARTVARTTFQWLTKAYLKQNPSPCSCRNILGPLYLTDRSYWFDSISQFLFSIPLLWCLQSSPWSPGRTIQRSQHLGLSTRHTYIRTLIQKTVYITYTSRDCAEYSGVWYLRHALSGSPLPCT